MNRPDFSGRWALDHARSTLRTPVAAGTRVVLEHDEPRLVQTMIGANGGGDQDRLTFVYTTDGRPSINQLRGHDVESRAAWDGNELVIESTLKSANRELRFRDHWSISDDGRTLTMAHPDDDLAGQISIFNRVEG